MPQSNLDELRRAFLGILPAILVATDACAQDAAKMQPQSYRVALDNEQVRVLDFVSRPGMGVCGTGMHSHPAHLTVLLTDGAVKVRNADGTVEEHRDLPIGTVFWQPPITHTVENLSGTSMRALIIELKAART